MTRTRPAIVLSKSCTRRTAGRRAQALLAAATLGIGGVALFPAVLPAAGQEAQDPPPQPQTTDQDDTAASTATAPSRNGESGGITRQNGGLVLNFEDASIGVVLDELSSAAGFIIVKEVEPEGRVTLTSRQPVSPDDAISLVNTVLHNAGYSAIQQGRILKIVRTEDARHLNIPVRSGSDPAEIEPTDELITQVIPLRHADARQLLEDLRPLVNENADFTANASSNALVMTDTSANVRRVVEIIAALDTSLAGSVEVKVFQLEYADASEAATLINEVFGDLEVGPGGEGGGGDNGDGRGRGDPREDFRRRMQQMMEGGGQGARGSNVNAAADTRTNSVVVTGPGDTLEIVSGVIDELDANPVADETVFVYRLRNAQAANIEGVLNSLFGNGSTTTTGASMNVIQNPLLNFRNSSGAGNRGGRVGGDGRRLFG